ncbi:hypothetical protein P691DRAFT_784802 [Macrolepiota fuliginosa MF-IS2]|uniref:Uncharacterized protein n=1 Tax=Macrolepiota fuliginosa MF-IS2 TaxID=1400762 RepID=A0A9P6C1X6_9AGAR|nr:hypothetical protein P691DRAFT_784802 [Macrolepiota fuliginosa MF-IS2]
MSDSYFRLKRCLLEVADGDKEPQVPGGAKEPVNTFQYQHRTKGLQSKELSSGMVHIWREKWEDVLVAFRSISMALRANLWKNDERLSISRIEQQRIYTTIGGVQGFKGIGHGMRWNDGGGCKDGCAGCAGDAGDASPSLIRKLEQGQRQISFKVPSDRAPDVGST